MTDSEIIQRLRTGEKHQFARLIDRYKNQSMTLAFRILKNREDAEEALQDAFVRAYNGLEKFEGSSKFSTWLYRIVYNVCLTRVERRKNELQSVEYDESIAGEISPMNIPLQHEIEMKDLLTRTQTVLELLPEKYVTVLTLFYFQNLSYDEICDVTQLPLGTVKVQLFRARTLLIDKLRHELQLENV